MASKGIQLKRLMDTFTKGATPRTYGLFVLGVDDDQAAIETDGYLDDDAERFTEGAGDILMVASDLDTGKVGLMYTVTRTDGDIALTLFKDLDVS